MQPGGAWPIPCRPTQELRVQVETDKQQDTSIRAFMDARPVTAFQYTLVCITILAVTFDGLDIQLVSLLSPAILEEWGISRAAFGPAMAAALVGMIFGSSLGGWLGDLYGRKAVLIGSIVLFGLATIGVSFTESVFWMSALRFISGLGFGGASPNSVALASEWLPERLRPLVAALLSAGVPLGGLIASLLLPGLLPALGWAGCFVLFGCLTLLLAFVMQFAVHESPGYLLAKGETRAAAQALQRIGGDDVVLPELAPGTTEQAAATRPAIFVPRYRRINIGGALTFFSVSFVAYGVLSWTPSLLTMVGFTYTEALRGLTAYNLASVVMAIGTSALITRYGSRQLLIVCCVASLLCLLAIGGVLSTSEAYSAFDKWTVIVLVGLYGGLSGAIFATLFPLLAQAYDTESRSSGVGFGMMVGRMGGITTILAGGYLLEIMGDNPLPFLASLVIATVSAIAGTCIIDRHIPKRA